MLLAPRRSRHRAATPARPRWFRAIAMTLAVLIPTTGVALGTTGIAQAAIVQWGTGSNQSPNYSATVNGDFLMTGNGVLACSGTALTATTTSGTCADLHANNPTASATTSYNDYFRMANNNAVSGFTTNSSSGTLTIPAGATVAKAYLGWSANTGAFSGTTAVTCSANAASGSQWLATRPDAAAGYRTQGVQLKVGTGAIQTVAPGALLEDPTTQSSALYYSATADVTAAFAGAATGSALTVSAGNIWAAVGAGCYAGWSLTVVYDYGRYIAGNTSSAPHKVIYYQGHVREASSDSPLTVSFTGFSALETGARFGYSLYEGDRGITGDYVRYTPGGGTATEVPNTKGASGNIGVGQADGSVRYTQTSDTSTFTNQSVDVHAQTLSGVPKGGTSLTLTVGTSGDSYLLQNAVLSVPTAALDVVKTLDGTTNNQYRTATENTSYTITVTNNGSVSLSNIQLTFPDTETCSPSSTIAGPLASGATATVRCTGPPPTASGTTSSVSATAQVSSDTTVSVTDTSSTNVSLSSLALTKRVALATGATGKAGDTVNYTFTATNDGTSPLTGVAITDPLSGLSALTYGTWPSGTAGSLAAGQSVTATATYTLTQDDVDAGSVANTASVTGTDPDGGPKPTATASQSLPLTAANTLALTKTGALAAGATGRAGDSVTWTFRLANTGAQTVTGATITDQLAGVSAITYGTWPSGTTGRLTPGQAVTATATSTLTQAQVDAGTITNTATAAGRSAGGATVTAPTATAPVAVPAANALVLAKTGALASGATGRAGDTVNWSFTLTNTGNQTVTAATIADRLAGVSAVTFGTWPSGTAGTLAPGQSVTAAATSTLTQTDADAGSIVNTAGASARGATGTTVTAPDTSATVRLADASALTIVKKGSLASGATGRAGDTVNWSFTVTNGGNRTLTGVTVADSLAGISAVSYGTWASGTTGRLAPGQSVTATATSTLTQAQVDAGAVTNTATASGTNPSGTTVTSAPSSGTVDIAAAQKIAVTKTGSLASGGTGGVGDTVNWQFSATNTGNTTLYGVAIADGLTGVSTLTYAWPGATGQLAPNQTVTATATYRLTQADVDAGSVVNTATAAGNTRADGTGQAASSTTSATVAVSRAAGITIAKTGALAAGSTGTVGDRVTYTFTVRNSGNTTLTNVAVTDPLAGLSPLTYSWPGTTGRLTPGQTATATATYALTQRDVDAGVVTNTATATGTSPDGTTATNSASARTSVPTSPAVTVTKTGALAAGATGRAGDTVDYTFTARNTGNQTLTNVAVTDALAGVSTIAYGTWPSGTAGTLAPGQSVTASASYTLTQADVDAGSVVNTGQVSARTPAGSTVSGTSPNTVPVGSAGALTFSKSGVLASSATPMTGSTVTWSFTARNTGNVTLTGVSIADQLPGISGVTATWPGTAGRLAPGQSVTATATSTLTQAQVDAGTVQNTASASGTTPSNTVVTQAAAGSVALTRAPGVTITKAGALAAGSTGVAGDTATWTLRITNSGNTTLTGVGATDALAGLSAPVFGSWPSGTAGTLAPGQSVTATATGTVGQTDVDAGSVTNTATATGTGPAGTATVTARGSGTIPLTASPALAFQKTVTTGPGWTGKAGDTLTYGFSARNTGNQTLTNVTLTDPHPGLSALTTTWPGTAGRLAPGETVTATARYTVTQVDVDAGGVANRATASATTPQGTTVTTAATASQGITPAPGVAVTKSAVVGGTGRAGDTVTYRFDLANTGTTTLTGVGVTDPLAGLSAVTFGTWPSGTAGMLAPGQTVRGTATYTITQSDIDAGSIVNTATTAGTAPDGTTVRGTGSTTVRPATAAPAIDLVKTERLSTNAAGVAGDVVRLGYTITNTGNQTLAAVALTDDQSGHSAFTFGAWPSTEGTLAPGQSVTATATAVLTQADVDRGSVSSTATATGTNPGAVTVRDTDTGSVTTNRTPGIGLTATGAVTTGSGGVGSVITWTYRATNTGTVTLTDDQVSHSTGGTVTYAWPGGANTLAPGATVVGTATSTVTQSDVDAGSVVDTSSVQGTAPTGTTPATVTATAASTVRTTDAAPALVVTKAETFDADGSTTRAATAGDQVDMAYTVRNAGNVTLTIVGVQDDQVGISSVQFGAEDSGVTTITLAPGGSARAFATYTLSQSDIDAGGVRSTATAFGTTPAGTRVTASAAAGVTVTPAPAVTLAKTARYATGTDGAVQSGRVGDTVVFSFLATNTGSVTLSGIALRDQLLGLTTATPIDGTSVLADVEWSGGVDEQLAPGERVRTTARYTVTQADVDRGSIRNDATVSGTAPAGGTASGDATVTIATDAANTAAVGIVKDAAVRGSGTPQVGDPVDLRYTVTNTGDFTLTGVALTDAGADAGTIAFGTWPSGTTGQLAPGQTVTATGVHRLTQADIDNGYVSSPATTTGTPENGGPAVTATAYRTVPVTQVSRFDFSKQGAPTAGTAAVGDRFTFTLTARNTGNTTLDLLQMADQLQGVGALTYHWPDPANPGTVLPSQSATATATYTITQADVDAGGVVNSANAVASPPTGPAITRTASSSTATDAAPAAVDLTKTEALADGATGVAGDTVRFGYTVTNTGTTTVTGVGVTDQQAGLGAVVFDAWPSGTTGTLAPGQSVTATATYRLTQADVDRAAADTAAHVALSSSATATATDRRSGGPLSDSDAGAVTLQPTSGIATRKTAAVVGAGDVRAVQVGDVVRYTVTATNTGQTTLTRVAVTDDLAGLGTPTTTWPNATAGTLAPGQAVVVTAVRTVTQGDVDAGSITNTATTTAATPAGTTVSGTGTRTVVTTSGAPSIRVAKSETLAAGAAGVAGDTVDVTLTVTNSGDVTLTGVTAADAQPGLSAVRYDAWPSGTAGTLAPGQSVVAHATVLLTQADVDRGSLSSTATAVGTPPRGAAVADSVDAGLTVAARPSLSFDKAGSLGGATGAVGDTVTYRFTIGNTGNVTVTGVGVDDVLSGVTDVAFTWPGAAGRLAPGQTASGTATYRVTQADVDAGSITNEADVTADAPDGSDVSASDVATVVLAAPSAGIELDKAERLAPGATGVAGDTVRFSYTITNTGTATLAGVTLVDPQPGLSAPTFGSWPGATGTLAPGQTVVATSTYTLTQADVDRGSIASTSTATATATTAAGTRVADSDRETVTLTAPAAVSLTKTAAYRAAGTGRVGDVVDYTFTVRNTGAVTVGTARITDQLAGLGRITIDAGPSGDGTLAPGQSLTATASYTITQADVDAGSVVNAAALTVTPARGADVGATASTTIRTSDAAPALSLAKTETVTATGAPRAGDTVRLGYTVTNTGNQTLDGVVVTDEQTGVSGIDTGAWPSGTAGRLAPGQSVRATATYALTQADIDAGRVASGATASGTVPTGGAVRATDTAGVDLAAAPTLSFSKAGRLVPGSTGRTGEGMQYLFTITNTGNVTVSGLAIADDLAGLTDPSVETWPGATGVLAPGQTVFATADYTIKQSDEDAGAVTNSASVSGRAPDGSTVGAADAVTVETAPSGPRIGVTKTATLTSGATGVAGDRVDYTYTLTNSGNVTLTGVQATDDQAGVTDADFGDWPSTAGRLAPGERVTATASHVLTQAEVDAGAVTSTVTATGSAPGGQDVSATDTRTVVIAPAPGIAFNKTAAFRDGGTGRAGDTVRYTFTATNTGSVTLSGTAFTDRLAALSAITPTWPGAAGTLAPGQTVSATADHVVTQADVDAGSIVNGATVTANPPAGAPIQRSDSAVVRIVDAADAITLTKDERVSGGRGVAGDLVTVTLTVTNTGNRTLTDVAVADDQPDLGAFAVGPWPGATGQLAPGQSVTATATHRLTQAEVDAGGTDSTATATASTPGGTAVRTTAVGGVDSERTADWTVDKTGTLARGSAGVLGDRVDWTYRIANTGTVTLTGVTLDETLPGVSEPVVDSWPTGAAGVLPPGQSVTATARSTVAQTDVDAGSIVNTATVDATPPTGIADPGVRSDSATVVLQTAAQAIAVTKTVRLADGASGVAGDTADFAYVVTNTGTATLTAVTLTDAQTGTSAVAVDWPGAAGVLAPGQSARASAAYVLTQADVDRGSQASAVTATGTGPRGTAAVATASASLPITGAPAITLTEQGALAPAATGAVGDRVDWTFVVRNTGTVTLDRTAVEQQLAGAGTLTFGRWPADTGVLAPGQVVTATASSTITQAQFDAGSVTSPATATASTPSGATVTSDATASVTTGPAEARIGIAKTAALPAGDTAPRAGDTVTLTYRLTNSGTTTLTGVGVVDTLDGVGTVRVDWPGTAGTLAPGATATGTATYTLTQADVDRGSLTSPATATGTPPRGDAVAATTSATLVLPAAPAITVTKRGAVAVGDTGAVGDEIDFTVTVRNTGTTTVDDVAVSDSLLGLGALAFPASFAGSLAPGQSATATATYTVTQDDVDAGSVVNTATGTANPPSGAPVTADDSATVPLAASTADVTITKTQELVDGATGRVTDEVRFTITVTNTGTGTLSGVTVTDDQDRLGALAVQWPGTAGVLRPGQSATATAEYALTQSDVDRGSISSTATTTGTGPTGTPVRAATDGTTTIAPVAGIAFSKTASYTDGGTGRVGDTVRYAFSATNTGTVTLSGVAISDGLAGLGTITPAWPGAAGTLAPGRTVTATATYTVTQADVDAGSIVNAGAVVGTPPTGAPVRGTDVETIRTVGAADLLRLTKDERITSGTGVAGDTVTVTYTVTNTGNRTLDGIALTDEQSGLSDIAFGDWPGTAGRLAPGQSVTATATHHLTQAEVDAGGIDSTATVTGSTPSGTTVSATAEGGVDSARTASWSFDKTGALAPGDAGVLGDRIDWTYRVTNTGTVTLTGVDVADDLPGVSTPVATAWPTATPGTLLPGQSVTATARSTVGQTDVDAGSVVNAASATAVPPTGVTVPGARTDSATVALAAAQQRIAVTKSAALADGADGVAGDLVAFGYVVTNTGTATLTGVTLADAQQGTTPVVATWPGRFGVLAPGESVRASASYTLSQADVDRGSQTSTVTATGTAAGGVAVRATDAASVTVTPAPAIALAEQGALAPGATGAVGDAVEWTFTVRNSGTVTLDRTAVAQQLAGVGPVTFGRWPGADGLLAPGQVVTASSSSTITQAQFDAGSVTNPARASASAPDGTAVTADATATVATGPADARIGMTKTAALPAGDTAPRAGDVVTFTYRVTNSGTSTLTGVAVADAQPGVGAVRADWPGAAGTLAPGQTVTATATYTLTQADVDRGSLESPATATGTPPTGADVTATTSRTLVLPGAPALTVAKSGVLAAGDAGSVGDRIDYSVAIRNTGTTTIDDLSVTDGLRGLGTLAFTAGFAGSVAPGQTITATASYTVTQSDVDAGSVVNTATATGNPPTGAPIDADGSATVPLAAASAGIRLDKTERLEPGATGIAGDTVRLGWTITNVGTATLSGIALTDEQRGLGVITYGSWPAGAGTLAPGESVSATAEYVLTQADVDGGTLASASTASATSSRGTAVADTDQASVALTAPAGVALSKTGAVVSGGSGRVGDVVDYTFTVRNTGQVTLSGIRVADRLAGLGPVSAATGPNGDGTLAPGQSLTAGARYTITQADVDAGSIVNAASVTATPARGADVTDGDSATVRTSAGAPAVAIEKTEQRSGTGAPHVGDVVRLGYTVTNTGNQTLTGVTVTDAQAGASAAAFGTWPDTAGTLAPGQTVTATATYTLTQADIDAGRVGSSGTVRATTPTGGAVAASDAAAVDLAAAPALTLGKEGRLAPGSTGQTGEDVQYRFTITNTGNVTITDLAIADPLPGLSVPEFGTWPGRDGALAPGQTVTAIADHTITQTDEDAGAVTNTATVSGAAPSGSRTTASDSTTVETAASGPRIGVTKTAVLADGATGVAGDRVEYSYTITNSGNVTLNGVRVTDDQAALSAVTYGPWPDATGTLAPGATVTATASHVLTQAEVDAGAVTSTATATGTPPAGAAVTATDTTTVVVAAAPSLAFAKTAAVTGGGTGRIGDTVRYTLTATNTGSVTLSGVAITDRLAGLGTITPSWPGATGVLAPGQQVTATADRTVTQADVDAGSVVNDATATANPPSGAPLVRTAAATIRTAGDDSIAVTKDERLSGSGVAGDLVTVTFTVTNTGDRTLGSVALEDDQPGLTSIVFGAWPGRAGQLAPGQSVTATATHRLTQAEVDAGGIESTATVRATSPSGSTVQATAAGGVDALRTAAWTLDKDGALAAGADGVLGDRIDWTYRVTNTGTVTLTGTDVADALPGVSAPTVATWPTGTAGVLLPGQTVTATARSTVTQTDVDAGSVVNAATATATAPTGVAVPSPAADSATVVLAAAQQRIAVTKTAALAAGTSGATGDSVTFGYVVTNTGTATLTGVSLADAQTGTSPITVDWPGRVGVLAPGESVRASASYTLSQVDLDRGSQTSTVTATGVGPGGRTVTAADRATVALGGAAAVALSEQGALAPGATGAVGDAVEWTFTVRNSGTVTLDRTAVAQQLAGVGAVAFGRWPGVDGVLAPGQVVTASSSSTITQAQFDAGSVTNPARASASAPDGTAVTADASATVVTGPADARIGITKTAALPDGDTAPRAGDVVTFTYRVTNSGTSTLSGVTVTDGLDGVSAVDAAWPGTPGVLAPGRTVTATATYTLSQADVDRGSLESPATATGTPPTGSDVTATSTATLVLPGAPALAVTKTGALADGATGVVGDRIDYTVAIRNTGTTTIDDLAVTDPLPGVGAPALPADFDGSLAPGRTTTATASYTVTQSDVDAGSVVNTATATGNPPTGAPVAADGSATVTLAPAAGAITLTKTQELESGAPGRAGDDVRYTFTVENTGTATLTGVTLTDAQTGLGPITVRWPDGAGVLRPGQRATATAEYTLTQADVDRGSISSTATATGTTTGGGTVRATDTRTTPVTGTAALAVTKAGEYATGDTGATGDTVRWTVDVRNSGSLTLTDVAVTDELAGFAVTGTTWPGTPGTLAPGQTVRVTGTSVVSAGDVDAGAVLNTARATGTAPDGSATTASGSALVPTAPPTPGITIDKTAALAAGATGVAGDTVEYRYAVRNNGDQTLRGVTIRDTQPGLSALSYRWPGDPGVLQPGQSVVATATYVLTQADVDDGIVSSPASVTGVSPDGEVVSDSDTAVIDLPGDPGGPGELALVKTAALAPGATGAVGDLVEYTFTVTNVGTTPLTDVRVQDLLPGLSALAYDWPGTPGSLAVGQQVTATATAGITQADVDAGAVVNTATASATGAGDVAVGSDAASATVALAAHAALAITKTVQYAPGTDGAPGQDLVYGFTVVNTGTVTLRDVRVDDRLAGLGAVAYGQWPGTPGVLAPGERVTGTARYTVGTADAASGSVTNSATAIGRPQPGSPLGDAPVVSAPDSVRITTHAAAGLPALAFTGSEIGPALAVALLLLLLGTATAVEAHRRRSRREHR